ncbi:MAG: N-acetylmuramoyl-L-alanine amidase [Paraclostridium sp.]
MKKIFIDAGHGGTDPGAIGVNIIEKEYNLKIANKVIEKLKNYNCEVFYSRNTDKTVSLEQRVQLSNKNNCDVFISIHCNSASNNNATGFETYSYKGNSTLQDIIHNEVIKVLPISDRGKKVSAFYVLKNTNAKAALLELGFINNSRDCDVLIKSVDEISYAITGGIVKHLGLSPISSTRDVYRVCVGSYSVKDNAENMVKQLEKDGYKPFITKATI